VVEPGRRCLADRYELGQLIASGGMGQVWRGTDVLLGRPVAVKVLRSEYTGDPTFLARFRAEAQHAASLSHPNIARVFDYGEVVTEDGSGETLAFLVMELVEGRPLSALLREDGPLDPGTTVSLLRQAGLALGEAHRVGMVHRDVKPGNILVRPDGSVKITDFGIAWSAGSVPLTRTGQVIGTPQYLSPEQAEGRLASPASDVYALGLVGYECLSGHSAFDGDNAVTIALKQLREQPEPLPATLPHGLRALIDRALVKDPGARLPDGAAFVDALEAAATGRPLPAPPVRTAPATPPARDPRPTGGVRVPPPRTGPHKVAAGRWRRRTGLVLLPLLALLAGAGIAAAVLEGVLTTGGGASGSTAAGAAVAADTGGRNGYRLVAADYVGRPVDEVAAQLAALGLDVQRQQFVTGDAAPGTVTAVDPVGVELRSGDPVVVSYAVPLPITASSAPQTRSQVSDRRTAAPTTPSTTATTPEAPAPAPAPAAPATSSSTTPASSSPREVATPPGTTVDSGTSAPASTPGSPGTGDAPPAPSSAASAPPTAEGTTPATTTRWGQDNR
jgi:serine/threonine-protein kinase